MAPLASRWQLGDGGRGRGHGAPVPRSTGAGGLHARALPRGAPADRQRGPPSGGWDALQGLRPRHARGARRRVDGPRRARTRGHGALPGRGAPPGGRAVPLTAVCLTRPTATDAKGDRRDTWFWWLGGRVRQTPARRAGPPLPAALQQRAWRPLRHAGSLVDGAPRAHPGADGTLDRRGRHGPS